MLNIASLSCFKLSLGPHASLPDGYAYLVDVDGNYILDTEGFYILVLV